MSMQVILLEPFGSTKAGEVYTGTEGICWTLIKRGKARFIEEEDETKCDTLLAYQILEKEKEINFLEANNQRLKDLIPENTKLKDKISLFEKEKDELINEVTTLQRENYELEQSMDNLRAENIKLKATVEKQKQDKVSKMKKNYEKKVVEATENK